MRAGYAPDLRDPLLAPWLLAQWVADARMPKLRAVLEPYVRAAHTHLEGWMARRDVDFDRYVAQQTEADARGRGRLVVRRADLGELATVRPSRPFDPQTVTTVHPAPHPRVVRLHRWIHSFDLR